MQWEDEARGLLEQLAGPEAEFREGQFEAIRAVFEERRKALVVQRTGWGKSAVYFIATALSRSRGSGPTLLVSPLLALMRNQIEAAKRLGIRAQTVNSTNLDEWDGIFEAISAGDVDLLLISPERLNNPQFRETVLQNLMATTGLLVVDEAHCISDWGHDFRPDYQRVGRILQYLPDRTPVLLTTATANERVIDDVVAQLGGELTVIRGSLDRASLRLDALTLDTKAERMAWLAEYLDLFPGSGIVYTLTVRDAELVAGFLAQEGVDAVAYSGQTDLDVKLDVERRLADNDVRVVVATSALGMGYDKPDLRWVIHFQSPGSPISYYQQVGRAGRAVDTSWGLLMSGREDADIQDFFIATAFPTEAQADDILSALEASNGLTRSQLLGRVNLRPVRLDSFLKQLEVGGFVERDGRQWFRTLNEWTYPSARVSLVTAQRRREQQAMRDYLATGACRMEYLRRLLDDPLAERCGRCANCKGRGVPGRPSDDAIRRAEGYLGSLHPVISPRRSRPAGWDAEDLLLPSHEEGVALTRWASPVTGELVRRGKQVDHRFDNQLVFRLAELLDQNGIAGEATYVTFVPSLHGDAVEDLAKRLAERLRKPFLPLIEALPGPPQKTMENSAQQAANALAKLRVSGEPPTGAGIIVDDIVDSRWTFTVACSLLLRAGAGSLYPVALADASNR